MLKMTARYMYSSLPPATQTIYKKIVEGIKQFNENIRISNTVDLELVKQVVECVMLDYPQFYYADFSRICFAKSLFTTEVGISYWLTPTEVQSFDAQISTKVRQIYSQLRLGAVDERTKLNNIYSYMVKNMQYDFTPNGNARYAHCVIGPMLFNKGVCEGISKSFKLLCDVASLSSIVVSGTAVDITNNTNVNHAWNIARIEGVCAHVDATWDICAFRSGNCFYEYFGLSDQEINRDHSSPWKLPVCKGFKRTKADAIGKAELFKELYDFIKDNKTQKSFALKSDVTEEILRKELQRAINVSVKPFQVDYSYNQAHNSVYLRKK